MHGLVCAAVARGPMTGARWDWVSNSACLSVDSVSLSLYCAASLET